MAYSAQKTPYGTYEIFRDGQRISTGSESALSNYGLSPTQLSYVPPKTPPTPAYNAPTGIASSSAIGMRPGLPPVSPNLPLGATQTAQSAPYTIKDFDDGSQWEVDATGRQIKQVRPPNISQSVYDYYRNLSSQGQQGYSPQETLAKLQGQISQGLYSGSVDEKKLFPSGVPGSTVPYGQTADVYKNLAQFNQQQTSGSNNNHAGQAGALWGAAGTPPGGGTTSAGTTGGGTSGAAEMGGTNYIQKMYELLLSTIGTGETPESEKKTQSEVDAITAQQEALKSNLSLQKAQLGTLPIATPIISGHQAEQTRLTSAQLEGLGAQALPLQTRLVREQSERTAKRQASLDIAKTGLEYGFKREELGLAKQKETREAKEKPITVSPGASLVDPTTGVPIFTAPRQPSEAQVEKAAEKEVTRQTAAQRSMEQTGNAITAIDKALGVINKSGILNPFVATSLGRSTLGRILPGEAADLRGYVSTVKALVGFGALEEMRKASPTGGALGQVSERELGFLQSTIASLDPGQLNKTLADNLNQIRNSFAKVRAFITIESGATVPVTITNTKTGEQITRTVNKDELIQVIKQGYPWAPKI